MVEAQVNAKSGQEEALDLLRGEMEQIAAELRDISMKVNQSRGQAELLAQRNAAVVGALRQMDATLEQVPRQSIRETYSEALDVQQRLLAVRGQMEKLQVEEAAANRMLETLNSAVAALQRSEAPAADKPGSLNASEIIMRVIDAQEQERERLARAMHDGPAHSLTNFILQAEICQKLFARDPARAGEELSNLKTAANDAFQQVRGFIFDLRPMMLTDLGLVPTLRRYLEAFKDKTGIETSLQIVGRERRLEHYREVLIFRGIQALMTNARDHSGASAIEVTVEMTGDHVRATVEDNGRGFGTGRLRLDASNSEALGLGALQERVTLVGGSIQIDSGLGGAKIEIDIPAGPEPEDQTPFWETEA
jgi:two-component system sensor histidine kinase DegS